MLLALWGTVHSDYIQFTCELIVGQPWLMFSIHPFKKIVYVGRPLMVRKINTTFNNGSLGSRIDEERSELRYVM